MNETWFFTLCFGLVVASISGAHWEAFAAGICVVLALGGNRVA